MTAPVEYLVCGDPVAGHGDACVLGLAETIAAEAHDVAAASGLHRLLAVVSALIEAGLVVDLPGDAPMRTVEGLLDALWELDLLPGTADRSVEVVDLHRSAEVVRPEAALAVADRRVVAATRKRAMVTEPVPAIEPVMTSYGDHLIRAEHMGARSTAVLSAYGWNICWRDRSRVRRWLSVQTRHDAERHVRAAVLNPNWAQGSAA